MKKTLLELRKESLLHYHEFIDACLDKKTCSAPFSYSSKLTETILLGVIAKVSWRKTKLGQGMKANLKKKRPIYF